MNKIPKETNLDGMRGAKVVGVAYASKAIDIQFDEDGLIHIEGPFCYSIGAEIHDCAKIFPAKEYGLLNLLDKKVREIKPSSSQEDLTITFADSSKLTLFADSDKDSYSVQYGKIDFVV